MSDDLQKKQFVCGACQREWIEYGSYEVCPYCSNRFVYVYPILKEH